MTNRTWGGILRTSSLCCQKLSGVRRENAPRARTAPTKMMGTHRSRFCDSILVSSACSRALGPNCSVNPGWLPTLLPHCLLSIEIEESTDPQNRAYYTSLQE